MCLSWSYILHKACGAGDGERIKAGRSSGLTLCGHFHIHKGTVTQFMKKMWTSGVHTRGTEQEDISSLCSHFE